MDTTLKNSKRVLKRVSMLASWCAGLGALSLGAHAGVQVQDDPMRPASAGVAAAGVNPALNPSIKGGADAAVSPSAAGQFSLKVTRANRAHPSVFVALVDDTWVRRGDLLAGYRVVAVNAESVELVDVANPSQRISLRMNPVTVQRVNSTPLATAIVPSVASSVVSSSASAPLTRRRALEK